ncbi:MAG: hypothetical protein RM368_24545 [Nostoc sp. DedSLP03]|uniref:hypothetical protein n=1 Tax=Nostoc sp. DedSLP03 TaxID=3075400 RepID=UPI002AD47090|nr:hypothetical protein [Nostoc sp. DedSLP03]MDZ7968082.1 hypothetical protein [Nostoc sp. DedSLP03]
MGTISSHFLYLFILGTQAQEYLIQQYAIVTTPSIRLTAPKSSDRPLEQALILGLTKAAIIDKQ